MKDTGRKCKLNNQGMTLVEVLVAMIIISVIGVAFLQSFSYAVKTNRLAKEKQQALSIAQTLMEATKAYSIETMDSSLDSLVFNSGTFTKNGSGDYKVTNVNGTGYDAAMTLTPGSVGASGKSFYDMELIQNPSFDTDALFVQDINNEMQKILEHAYNGMIADPSSIIVSTPVPPVTVEEQRQKVTNFLINGLSDYSLMEMKYFHITSRQIKLVISGDSVEVNVIYKYVISNYPFTYVDDEGTEQNDTFSRGETPVSIAYTNCYTGSGDIRAVYAYFYPLYASLGTISYASGDWIGCAADEISIISAVPQNISVYLLKQKLQAANPINQTSLDTQLASIEAYKPLISRVSTAPIDFYHNLSMPLYKSSADPGVGYDLSANFLDDGNKDCGGVTKKVTDTQLIYDVEIEITKGGNHLLTLKGTANAR